MHSYEKELTSCHLYRYDQGISRSSMSWPRPLGRGVAARMRLPRVRKCICGRIHGNGSCVSFAPKQAFRRVNQHQREEGEPVKWPLPSKTYFAWTKSIFNMRGPRVAYVLNYYQVHSYDGTSCHWYRYRMSWPRLVASDWTMTYTLAVPKVNFYAIGVTTRLPTPRRRKSKQRRGIFDHITNHDYIIHKIYSFMLSRQNTIIPFVGG
jgi:hypothetical protein